MASTIIFKRSVQLVSAFGLVGLACASNSPTSQLVDARAAYQQARLSEAGRLTPDKLYDAKQALDRAEAAHQDDPGSYREQSLAYVAHRQSELAMTHGRIAKATLDEKAAGQQYTELQTRMLDQSKQQVAAAEQQLSQQESALKKNAEQLEAERKARVEAEERAKAAMNSLAEVAKVKEDSRGTIITLDGAVLFASGQSTLLPIAEKTLSDVAKALLELPSQSRISVVGYTDSVGSSENNQRLSQQRAQSVRDFLVTRGVPSERLDAVGRGEEQPVASNDTPEGRANNRRVELIVSDTSQASLQTGAPR
jgi:outer membrane protein OmpA-like peptidoglycan-associated protein